MTLETNACIVQIGRVVPQKQLQGTTESNGNWHRSITDAEKRYSPTQRICLPIAWAILLLRTYLGGHWFAICTKHETLKWILNLVDSTGWLIWWRLRLSEFVFKVVHRADVIHQAVNSLSPLTTNGEETSPLKDNISLLVIDTYTSENTPTNNDIVVSLQSLESPTLKEFLRAQVTDTYCHIRHAKVGHTNFAFNFNSDDLLIRCSRVDGALQIIVLILRFQRILILSHHPSNARHHGQRRMYNTLRRAFY